MPFNPSWRPLTKSVDIRCDYPHLPYRLRQKMPAIQSYMLEMRQMSKNDYRLVLLDDGCCVLDPINNKLLCYYDYLTPIVVLMNHLEELWQFWRYEANIYKPKTIIEVNHYLTLKNKYIYGR